MGTNLKRVRVFIDQYGKHEGSFEEVLGRPHMGGARKASGVEEKTGDAQTTENK